jgi:hypothetical protein
MQKAFDSFWAEAQYATGWTNAMLPPPGHDSDKAVSWGAIARA